METEYAFEMSTSAIRFGFGVTREVGPELADLGKQNVLVFTDPLLRSLPPVATALQSLEDNKIRFSVFDRVRVEPTDESFLEAIAAAQAGDFDAFVAVGGGSTMDTAKAANLYSCYPADLLEYVNAPVGKGRPVPGPLKPLIAIPTTAGTGSETTGVAVFDYLPMHAKTGIASRRLKPTIGLIDPENTRTQPSAVAASAGLDVLSHAIESYTVLPFNQAPAARAPIPASCLPRGQSHQRCLEPGIASACSALLEKGSRPTHPTTKHALPCYWRRPTQESASATRACTCRTACPTPCQASYETTARQVTRWTIPWCRTASPSSSTRRRCIDSLRRHARSVT